MQKTKDTQKYDEWRARLYASFETLNIIAEFERHGGTKLTPVNKYNPGQHHGACPWYLNCPEGDDPCDADEDGFLVWPTLNRELQNGDARPRHFWCRKCLRSGDIANFLEMYLKIKPRQACALLGINPNDETILPADISNVQKRVCSGPSNDQAGIVALLTRAYPYAQQMLTHPRALAYLEARAIPLEIAQALGVGYIPVKSKDIAESYDQWYDKILFPAQSPDGLHGFRGRTLTGWHPGMDEKEHRELLQTKDIAPWLATYEDGYFNWQALHTAECPVLVEGGFDVLACHAVGIQAVPIGTNKLPSFLRVRQVIVALDNDEGGRIATKRVAAALGMLGIGYRICTPPDGTKDWSEAYRLFGAQGLISLKETVQALQFCEDCGLSSFSARKTFQEHYGRFYCTICFSVLPVVKPRVYDPIPDQCEDCGMTTANADERGFFYWQDGESVHCFCDVCRDEQTGLPMEKPLLEEEPTTYLTTATQILSLASFLEDGTYVLDLETTGLDPRKSKVITIALGMADKVWVIDVRSFYAATVEAQEQWKDALQSLLHRDTITWAGHNLKFDWSFLAVHFGIRLRRVYDTMLVERLIHNGERVSVSLLNTATRYELEVTKEERNWFVDLDQRDEWHNSLPPEQLAYIEQDIRVPHVLIEKQKESIGRLGLTQVIDLENGALPMIAAMEVKGISVDVARWERILQMQRTRHLELTVSLKQALGMALANQKDIQQGVLFGEVALPDVNLGSSDQLAKGLQALGITVSGTSKEALEDVKSTHTIIPHVLEWKKLEKFITAFGKTLLQHVGQDGRIHATFEQLGADSGRMSCREPNLQQIPKPQDDDTNVRRCFVAQEGCKLLVADLSNIELRILAEASQDPTMLRFFAEGKDLHSETAKLMFKLPPETDTKKHLINGVKARDIAKTINFGLAYGMGPSGLANRVGVNLETAKRLMQIYFATYKGVDGYLKRTGRKGAKEGYAVTLAGRRRLFAQEDLSNPAKRGRVERAAKNHPIQGTNADILKRALALLFKRLPDDIHVVLTVHDEIVLEAPVDSLEDAEHLLKECMMDACREFLKRVVVPEPDVLVADYWVKG